MLEVFIIGLLVGVYLHKMYHEGFKMFGYELMIRKQSDESKKNEEVVHSRKDKVHPCDLCRGEKEIRLSGSSTKMECPKCRAKVLEQV
jgi:hypothetical protein